MIETQKKNAQYSQNVTRKNSKKFNLNKMLLTNNTILTSKQPTRNIFL